MYTFHECARRLVYLANAIPELFICLLPGSANRECLYIRANTPRELCAWVRSCFKAYLLACSLACLLASFRRAIPLSLSLFPYIISSVFFSPKGYAIAGERREKEYEELVEENRYGSEAGTTRDLAKIRCRARSPLRVVRWLAECPDTAETMEARVASSIDEVGRRSEVTRGSRGRWSSVARGVGIPKRWTRLVRGSYVARRALRSRIVK